MSAFLPAIASAGPYKVKLQAISGPSPFAAGCPGALFDDTNPTGLETEPFVTVNPARPANIIATWKQDGTRTDLIASSLNHGKTWKRSTIPGLSACTGGTADGASDPWVSAAVDGTVYFAGLPADLSTDPQTVAVVASHSGDGGRTWPAPATVAPPREGNDTDAIAGSPDLPGHAYVAWANFTGELPRANPLEFARTSDGGATWSAPVLIDQPSPFAWDQAPRILVLPDGTLLTVFARADFATGRGIILAARSRDEGRTWLPAVRAGSKPISEFHDPEHRDEELPQPGFESAAVAPDGTIYVAFEDSRSPTSGAIGVLRSRDGGLTWSRLRLPGVTAFAFEPAIAVDKHGTVGVTWYDLRNDVRGDAALTADVWFAHSDDRGRSWRQRHVAGPTDLRTAAPAAKNRVGEYQGLAALGGGGFAAVFTLASPQATDGPTDIFFAKIAHAPQTRISGKRTRGHRAVFRFRASERSTFQCKLKGKRVRPRLRQWRHCGSRAFRHRGRERYRTLRPGGKIFKVRAMDRAHATDPTPAKRRWRVR